jgi:hypothetical protein
VWLAVEFERLERDRRPGDDYVGFGEQLSTSGRPEPSSSIPTFVGVQAKGWL